MTRYLKNRLKLTVNEEKSAVDRPWNRKFLGFSILSRERRIRLAPQTLKKVEDKIRSLTKRNAAMGTDARIEQLNQYLGGWIGYFALVETPSIFEKLDSWVRARMRMCQWKQWKRVRTRVRELRALGLKELDVWEAAGSRKAYWRIAHSPPLHKAMSNAYWQKRGLMSLKDRYHTLRQAM